MTQEIKFPFGEADVQVLSATGDQDLTVSDALTILDGVTNSASGNRTINLTIGDGTPTGAMVVINSKTAGTETLTFGTGITGAVLTGVTGKTFGTIFVFDGTNFIQVSTPIQID